MDTLTADNSNQSIVSLTANPVSFSITLIGFPYNTILVFHLQNIIYTLTLPVVEQAIQPAVTTDGAVLYPIQG